MINIYTDSSLLLPENRGIAHPLVFDLHYFENTDPIVFDYYRLVSSPELADVFVFPVNYLHIAAKGYVKNYEALYKLAQKSRKKLMVYVGGDYGKTFCDDSIITWRTAGFKSSNDLQTVIIPAFIKDPLARKGMRNHTQDYTEHPQISFTGFATGSFKEALRNTFATLKGNAKRLLKKEPTDKQVVFNAAGQRFKFLKILESSNLVYTQFIYRDKYRAGARTEEERERTTTEFYTNLNESPYTFCSRGAGNFSIRFYESLACGRIPVLVDTDVQLPLESVITWDNHICRVTVGDDIPEKLVAFHKKFDTDSFMALQKSNRKLFMQTLQRHHFFCTLYLELKKLL